MPVSEELQHAVLPRPGERHVAYLGPLRAGGSQLPGFLVLTTERVIFVRAPSLGMRSYQRMEEAYLERIGGLSVHEGRLSSVLTIEGHSYTYSHLMHGGDANRVLEFRSQIASTREQRIRALQELPLPPPPPPPPPTPSAPLPVHREREIVREVVKVPCRYCGQLVSITDVRCGACGAALGR